MFNQRNIPAAPQQDQLVWKILFDRQTALLHRRAAPAFSQGLARLGLRREALPDIGELSATVREHTGWQLAPVGRSFAPAAFFALLAERKFPIVTRIRAMHSFDFSPEPDLFHDLFGHVPMLLDEGLADFLHQLGQAYQAQPVGSAAREQLWALYFFTAEFGLVQVEGRRQGAEADLALRVHVGHFQHHQEVPLDAYEIALRTEPGKVGIKTEQCA